MGEDIRKVIERFRQNSQNSAEPPKQVENEKAKEQKVEEDEEEFEIEEEEKVTTDESRTAKFGEKEKEGEKERVEEKSNAENIENTSSISNNVDTVNVSKESEIKAIQQQIEGLQNNGVFRIELLSQLEEIRKALTVMANVLIDISGDGNTKRE